MSVADSRAPDSRIPHQAPENRVEGLRERKKRRTRQAIIDTAHELFHEKGYEATTVEAIAAGADVSVRTFFRYFASKEAVALAPLDEMGDLTLAALRRRPADEPPLAALRGAALSALAMLSPDGAALRHYADHLLPLGGSSPLAGAVLSRLASIGDRLAAELVEDDEPVDPDGPATAGHDTPADSPPAEDSSAGGQPTGAPLADARPAESPAGRPADARRGVSSAELDAQLVVFTFLGAVQVAVRAWLNSGSTDLDDLLATVEGCLDRIVIQPGPR